MTLSRRSLLAAAPAGLVLSGCATTGATSLTAKPEVCLPPVRVSDDRVIRNIVGLRPFREEGFVVRAEPLGDKTIVHNYGHGGGGVTLSWGTGKLAIDLGLPGHSGPVAVLGAGVVGLTTARLVQEAGFPVTIYAAELPPATTSMIAGGQWHPSFVFRRRALTPAFEAQLGAACGYAYRRFQVYAGRDYGVRWMRNYEIRRSEQTGGSDEPWLAGMLPEVAQFAPGQHPFGDNWLHQWTGMLISPPVFLRRLMNDIQIAGGRIVTRRFPDRQTLAALPEKLVFNCTGLGARDLFGDQALRPMRGQLAVLLPQAEVDYAISKYNGAYMFSREDGIVLGGSSDLDDWRLEPDPAITASILARHKETFSSRLCTTAKFPI